MTPVREKTIKEEYIAKRYAEKRKQKSAKEAALAEQKEWRRQEFFFKRLKVNLQVTWRLSSKQVEAMQEKIQKHFRMDVYPQNGDGWHAVMQYREGETGAWAVLNVYPGFPSHLAAAQFINRHADQLRLPPQLAQEYGMPREALALIPRIGQQVKKIHRLSLENVLAFRRRDERVAARA